jgi:hypothetical protein
MDLNDSVDPDPGEGDGEGAGERAVERGRRRPEFLFVVTYGRSGSTLVQGLLNSLPGTLVRGENNFYILPMFRSYDLLATWHRRHGDDKDRGPRWAFYGIDEAQPDEFPVFARRFLMKQLLGTKQRKDVRVLGFKEIRWYGIEPKETKRFFEFFEEVFPGARYVLNRRDHEQVSTSGFWQKQESDEVMATLRRIEEIQDYLRETRPERTHLVRYEEVTHDDTEVSNRELRSLAEFVLGVSNDALIAQMRATMAKGHGPRPFGRSRVDQGSHEGAEA